jgi:hypothetical protein
MVTDGLAVFNVQLACALARGMTIARAAAIIRNLDMFTIE